LPQRDKGALHAGRGGRERGREREEEIKEELRELNFESA
jgi:hypothetical protein